MKPTVQVKGGQKLSERLEALKRKLTERVSVKVGVPSGSGDADGTPLVVIAATHEFGATINHPGGTPYKPKPGGGVVFTRKGDPDAIGTTKPHKIVIPERSFLRVPLRANKDLFQKIIKNGLKQVLREDITTMQLMDQLGSRAASVSQEAISSGISPANAPSTIRRKGSSKPLVGTDGRLLQSITWEVSEE